MRMANVYILGQQRGANAQITQRLFLPTFLDGSGAVQLKVRGERFDESDAELCSSALAAPVSVPRLPWLPMVGPKVTRAALCGIAH